MKKSDELFLDCFAITASFWTIQNGLQRLFGAFGFRGRMPLILTTFSGMMGTSSSILTSNIGKNKLNTLFNENKIVTNFERNNNNTKKENIRSFILGLSLFILLERSLFRTLFPSSSISLGVISGTDFIFLYKEFMIFVVIATKSGS